jgi:hypothetical protein
MFSSRDTTQAPGVVIVSESAAAGWPGRDPIGQRLSEPRTHCAAGVAPAMADRRRVVEDVRYRGLNDVRLDMLPRRSRAQGESLMIRTAALRRAWSTACGPRRARSSRKPRCPARP